MSVTSWKIGVSAAVVLSLAAPRASAQSCKGGRVWIDGACREPECSADSECGGDLVCDGGQCTAASPATAPEERAATPEEPAAGDSTPIPRSSVDQPLVVPEGVVQATGQLDVNAASGAGRKEITFGEWEQADFTAFIGMHGWQLISSASLKLAYPQDDAPALWSALVEADRLTHGVEVGVQLFTFFPTERYYQLGVLAGAAAQRRVSPTDLVKLHGYASLTAYGEDATRFTPSAYGEWYHQLTPGLATHLGLGIDLPLTSDGDASTNPFAIAGLEYFTPDLWIIAPGIYASPDVGSLRLQVGKVF